MSDETPELAPELETANPEPVDDNIQPEAELEVQASGEGEEGQPEDDGLDDLEWEGIKTRVPKDLKGSLEDRLRHMSKHFTTKSQTLAAQEKEWQTRINAANEELDVRANLKAVDAEIQQYANVDWQKLEQEDLVGAQSHWRRYQQLKEARQGLSADLDTKVAARTEQAKQETAQRLQETREYAEKKIPGWTPEVDAKVTQFATSELGFTPDFLIGAYNPQVYRALHLAWLGHQTLNKPAPKPAATVQTIKPTQTVAARSNPGASKSLAEMDMDEYAAHRQKQMAAARGR